MKPTLFLFMGYPGAGKTTIAKLIAELTSGVHIWTDQERHRMFSSATHSITESNALYDYLNQKAETLLADNKSVIYDTNFNFYSDRSYLASLAQQHGAQTVIVWVTTPRALAQQRALAPQHHKINGYAGVMSLETYRQLTNHLEPPQPHEHTIRINGEGVTKAIVSDALRAYLPDART